MWDSMINKRYNREETPFEHYYYGRYGFEKLKQEVSYEGYIKCKLVHEANNSLIIPDLLFIKSEDGLKWIQPLCFLANQLMKYDQVISCNLFIDISCGNTVRIVFRNDGFVKSLYDGSQLFQCQIIGLLNLSDYATGSAYLKNDIPYVELYHHTKHEFKKKILSSMEFKVSEWNIQGNKRLKNVAYLYMTPLNAIKKHGDLIQIAMSSTGKITLITDKLELPRFHDSEWLRDNENEISTITVYRENTKDRSESIQLFVEASTLSPQHINRHYFNETGFYYEICRPFIHRIAVGNSEEKIGFFERTISHNKELIVSPSYIIIGNCLTKKGIEAPYNEEETDQIFKIENTKVNILEFWFDQSNRDHYSGKIIKQNRFK